MIKGAKRIFLKCELCSIMCAVRACCNFYSNMRRRLMRYTGEVAQSCRFISANCQSHLTSVLSVWSIIDSLMR